MCPTGRPSRCSIKKSWGFKPGSKSCLRVNKLQSSCGVPGFQLRRSWVHISLLQPLELSAAVKILCGGILKKSSRHLWQCWGSQRVAPELFLETHKELDLRRWSLGRAEHYKQRRTAPCACQVHIRFPQSNWLPVTIPATSP